MRLVDPQSIENNAEGLEFGAASDLLVYMLRKVPHDFPKIRMNV